MAAPAVAAPVGAAPLGAAPLGAGPAERGLEVSVLPAPAGGAQVF